MAGGRAATAPDAAAGGSVGCDLGREGPTRTAGGRFGGGWGRQTPGRGGGCSGRRLVGLTASPPPPPPGVRNPLLRGGGPRQEEGGDQYSGNPVPQGMLPAAPCPPRGTPHSPRGRPLPAACPQPPCLSPPQDALTDLTGDAERLPVEGHHGTWLGHKVPPRGPRAPLSPLPVAGVGSSLLAGLTGRHWSERWGSRSGTPQSRLAWILTRKSLRRRLGRDPTGFYRHSSL